MKIVRMDTIDSTYHHYRPLAWHTSTPNTTVPRRLPVKDIEFKAENLNLR